MNSDGIHTRLSRISSFQQAGFALTGFAAMAGVTIKAISLLRRAKFFQNKTKPAYEDEKSMTLEEIEGYTKSPNINLRRSAEQLLLEKVLSSAHVLDELLKWCLCGDENEIAKAATVLCVLIKSVDTRGHPWEKPYILTLAEMILQSLNPQRSYKVQADDFTVSERIQRLSTCALFELVCDATAQKDFLVANYPDIVPCILHLVVNSRCKEVSRYALFLTHQIAIQESTRQALIDANGVKIVAQSLMIHQGDPMLQRLSLQMLTVFSTMPESDSKQMLSGIAEEGVIVPTVVCLKSEDPECTYWAVALLHEFAINDVCKGRIIEVYGLLRALSQTLVDSEANQQRLLLRLLCFLAVENETFKNDILQCNDIVSRLPVFYASGDKDVVHWALVLTHDLAMTGKAATTSLLNTCPDLVSAMVPLTAQAEYVLKRLLAETLGFFCSNEHYMLKIIRNGVLVTILQYATCEDEQLKYWSAAVMLNMAMTSDAVKLEILQAGGLSVIMELAIGDHSNTQISVMAAKSLVMLGFTDKPLSISVLCDEDNARVRMNKKIYHLNKPGLNIMVWNTLTAESVAQLHYHINNPWEAQDLGVKIPHKPQDEGNLVIIVIRGQYGQIYLKAMKDLLVISAKSSVRQDSLYQLQESEMCVIVATLLNSGMLDVNHVEKAATINMEFQFPYNEIVNHRVSEIVLIPIIRVLFGTAPSSPISKVMELDLLEVLARHSGHCETMLNCDGFLDYLNSILYEFTKTLSESQDYPPIAVAHCLGALKVLSVLSVSGKYI
ncbi:uncharacterized protein LOC106175169 [Lingula anatina]|uniref:Uncharacterized protein LOC106175169 n=1 Tax=Lingula anatina TaxID=7574 RepID=A0A1S3JR83_LINAN|nr:uncharacterized protein LOC106175169 [Lingula anatina]|eukprot:XP_013412494.1 uncharacterized protein LOC106175169 [Lingula anatina]